ncbi:DUF481 domain-containing protein [Ekhidna sp.]|uniref:DUF481 domain-containing protein n=1 Tax=Ekhidna sp. TaxID=2608089 RepID=UPI003B510D84
MKIQSIIAVCICLLFATALNAQILFTESYSVILDSTSTVKGSILPGFKYQNQRETLIEIENQADLSVRIKDNAITFANQIAISRFGSETILSGGYVYSEFRHFYDKAFTTEYYAQVHWAEARGMERKYAAGVNARWRLHKSKDFGLFVGIGPFYEYEKWNYDGISDTDKIPANDDPREQENVKLGSYISLKYNPIDQLSTDISLYHQARFDELVNEPRLASSARIRYNFTSHLGLALTHQLIYDPAPIVPIDNLFQKLDLGLSITF